MDNDLNTPYANLEPSLILDAIESVGFHCSGSLLALNSYENRVYQVGLEEGAPVIAKFYRPHRWSNETILEEHNFALELLDHEIPIVAPLKSSTGNTLHHYNNYRFAIFPRWGGRALELGSLEQLEWMGRFIGRFHAISASKPFLHRPRLDIQTHGYIPYQYLIEHDMVPAYLKENYCSTVDTVLQRIEECFHQAGNIPLLRIHGDIHPGNVLWNDAAGPHIVDLDDCVTGPATQDIWMLLSGDPTQVEIELHHILRGYREFHDFNPRELILTEALRSLRMIQYSAWLASRWNDPAFPPSFPWFNTPHYWQEQIQNLREQIGAIEAALEQAIGY